VSATTKVSIVVPARDAAGDIDRLLDALDALEWPPDAKEVIVIDDASTDDTRERIVAHPHVQLVPNKERKGPYASRNIGTGHATGEWVVFTDADCAPRPDWLAKLLAEPIDPDTGAIAGEVIALETATPTQRFIEKRGFMKHSVTLPHKALPGFSTANVAIRRDVLWHLGGFREDVLYFGDMELSWRMQIELERRLVFRPDAVVLHRHRRTVGALWRQAVQHGRGVAFMKRTYPDVYRISGREQAQRVGEMVSGTDSVFLALWWAGMVAGYLRGPAWVDGRRGQRP
jgi:cellulose synthase/poly-beta-1,6-N-acetylglucosamine synthase-like glycosyltransferase